MTILTQASNQWMTRPADERFVSLPEMHAFKLGQREQSKAGVVSSRQIRAHAVEGDLGAIEFTGPNGVPVTPTNWAFGQLAGLAGAPAGYMRKLPGPLAADCINYGFQVTRDIEDVGVLVHKPVVPLDGDAGPNSYPAPTHNQPATLLAATGPKYGRIWDEDIIRNLISYVGDGVTGDWRVPGEFGKAVTVDRENTTLYASDRDMFVFLADEKNLIEIPNRRDGEPGAMSRGFFLWNSEVGSKTFGISTFLFDYVCMNRIVWGAQDVNTVTIRHSAGAPDKFIEQAVPALETYSQGSTGSIVEAIEHAKAARIDVAVEDFLASRQFSRPMAKRIMETHEVEEGRPIETLWDATTGITAVARTIAHIDERVAMERQGGALIDLAA